LRVLSKRTLREFWRRHPETEAPLNSWHKVAERSEWSKPQDVRNSYRSADPVGKEFVVFDICNNDYRLVVRIDYERGIVYVFGVFTHAEYDKLDLREIDQQIEKEKRASELR
jgi:mRNA interferase HigB